MEWFIDELPRENKNKNSFQESLTLLDSIHSLQKLFFSDSRKSYALSGMHPLPSSLKKLMDNFFFNPVILCVIDSSHLQKCLCQEGIASGST